jgi:hypothetical protein
LIRFDPGFRFDRPDHNLDFAERRFDARRAVTIRDCRTAASTEAARTDHHHQAA